MNKLILLLLFLPMLALGQGVKLTFSTTNTPTVTSNIVKSLATNAIAENAPIVSGWKTNAAFGGYTNQAGVFMLNNGGFGYGTAPDDYWYLITNGSASFGNDKWVFAKNSASFNGLAYTLFPAARGGAGAFLQDSDNSGTLLWSQNGSGLTNLNASNLASGTVPSARGGAGTVSGVMRADGAGVVSAATFAQVNALAPANIITNGYTLVAALANDISSTADISARAGNAAQVKIGNEGPNGEAGMTFGISGTERVYKSATGVVAIDTNLFVPFGGLQVGGTAAPTSGLNVSNTAATAGSQLLTNGNANFGGALIAASIQSTTISRAAPGSGFYLQNQLLMTSPSDGVLTIDGNTVHSPRIQLGGTTAAFPSLKRVNGDLEVSDGPGTGTTNNFKVPGTITATNGVASYARNQSAPTAITFTGSPFNWTNSSATAAGGTNNVVVYIDSSVGAVDSIAKNGGTIATSPVGLATVILQAGQWLTVTYTVVPSAKFDSF